MLEEKTIFEPNFSGVEKLLRVFQKLPASVSKLKILVSGEWLEKSEGVFPDHQIRSTLEFAIRQMNKPREDGQKKAVYLETY
jgi:hypothetical protein